MELGHDLVVKIISYLPLKLVVQCKVLSKDFNIRISDTKFSQSLVQRQKISTLLIYSSSDGLFHHFQKIFLNPISTTQCKMELPVNVSILASCKGLLLLDLPVDRNLCVFNPLTGAHQLIPYPHPPDDYLPMISYTGIAVDYPTSDQFKLVIMAREEVHNNVLGIIPQMRRETVYKFQVFSSEGSSGMWHEVKLKKTSSNLDFWSKPVYVHESLHWLISHDCVLAFDTKREHVTVLDLPKFTNYHDPNPIRGNIIPKFNIIWFGAHQGLLTLICLLKESTVIYTYDNVSSNWRVSHTSADFFRGLGLSRSEYGYPFKLDRCHLKAIRYLYEYDREMNNRYAIAAILDQDDNAITYHMPFFTPSLASVRKTFASTISTRKQSDIAATLRELKRFIIDGTR